MRTTIWALALLSYNVSAQSTDNSGQLPKKKAATPTPTEQASTATSTTVEAKPVAPIPVGYAAYAECLTYQSSYQHPRISFDKNYLYYLARKAAGKDAGQFKYELQRLSLKRDKNQLLEKKGAVEALISFDGPKHLALLVHGMPTSGFSVLSFDDAKNDCGMGRASGITIPYINSSIAPKPPSKTVPTGEYAILESNVGRLFVDAARGIVKTIDPQSAQQRVVYQSDKVARPLYWDASMKNMYLWSFTPQPMLSKRGSVVGTKLNDLPIARGEKIVQDGSRFAVMRVNASDNTIGIAQLNQWSTPGKSLLHMLKLPKGISASEAQLSASFSNDLAVVYTLPHGNSPLWEQLYVFKFKSGLASEFKIPANEQISAIQFSQKKDLVFAVFEHRTTGLHAATRVYDSTKNTWIDLK